MAGLQEARVRCIERQLQKYHGIVACCRLSCRSTTDLPNHSAPDQPSAAMADTEVLIQQALKAEEAERKLQKQQKHDEGVRD
jgi:hypothetical protein